MSYMKKILVMLIAATAVLWVSSCTTEREAVDKSPQKALSRAMFSGEFFYRQTIFDLPYTADMVFIGQSNEGAIIKWKFTENWLIAYNIHDKKENVNTDDKLEINETPVLAYPILHYFDILPQENPTTGEDMPLKTVNKDRPWDEREYFEIDMSKSWITDFEMDGLTIEQRVFGNITKEAVAGYWGLEFYSHNGGFIEPKSYKENLESGDINSEVEWFQFFNKEYVSKRNNTNNYYNGNLASEPIAVTSRHLFVKMNRDVYGERVYDPETAEWVFRKGSKDNGYRPLEYKDEMFSRFGFFRSKFQGVDPKHGQREDNLHYYANLHNTAWADAEKNWNFRGTEDDIAYQQKVIYTSSPETPVRHIMANCAMSKDYNHAMLAARYASLHPGSDTKAFDAWYTENYNNDFFRKDSNGKDIEVSVTVDGKGRKVKIRDTTWHMDAPENWTDICFTPNSEAFVQDWFGELRT